MTISELRSTKGSDILESCIMRLEKFRITQSFCSFPASGQLKLYVGPDGSVSLDNRASKKNYEQVVFDRDGTKR